ADEQVRLPSEAEWEAAAMWDSQTGQMRPWQSGTEEIRQNSRRLWEYLDDPESRTTPVGLFSRGASQCGALDMAGNVWEWCNSCYDDYPQQAHRPWGDIPTIISDLAWRKMALRGGAYHLDEQHSGWDAREPGEPGIQYPDSGFRLCRCTALVGSTI